jgi:hypothetical protein
MQMFVVASPSGQAVNKKNVGINDCKLNNFLFEIQLLLNHLPLVQEGCWRQKGLAALLCLANEAQDQCRVKYLML